MKVLVAYASRHGATEGIAERIAEALQRTGHKVDVERAENVDDVDSYDAFVIGAAAYMFHWLKAASQFVRRHRELLVSRPVWLFSSGPIGTDTVDKEGRDVLEVTRPREFAELERSVRPRDMRVFFGAFYPEAPPIGIAERVMAMTPARKAMPAGDFRDWAAIEAWAASIAQELSAVPRPAATAR